MGSHVYKTGYATIHAMMKDVVDDLIAGGFSLKFPASVSDLDDNGNYTFDLMRKSTTKKRWCAILETTSAVNAKADDKWVIKFEWDINEETDGILDVIVGTPVQFNYETGEHSYYVAKYMSSQKKVVVASDPTRTDRAYEYKEVVGILGTTFRNNDVFITFPDFINPGAKKLIKYDASSPAGGKLSSYPNGEEDIITNYRSVKGTAIAAFGGIDPADVSNTYSSLLGSAGGGSSAKVAYDEDWSFESTNKVNNGAYIYYQNKLYKAKSTINDISVNKIVEKTEEDILENGRPAGNGSTSTAPLANIDKYLIGTDVFQFTSNTAFSALPDLPNQIEYGMQGKVYKTPTQIVKISDNDGLFRYYTNNGYAYRIYTVDPTSTFIANQSIVDQNGASATIIAQVYSKTLNDSFVASTYYGLIKVATGITTTDLTPATAAIYNMEYISNPELKPVYIYDSVQDRVYKINSAISANPSANTAFPTSTSDDFQHGAYNLSYIGLYSDFQAASSIGIGSTYYSLYESEDADGYDTRLVDGDFSFPAIKRSRNRCSKMFYNREYLTLEEVGTYPLAYTLSMTDRGVVFSINEVTSDSVGNRNSWVVIQRPVDHVSGEVYATGKAPVHCMYSIMSRHTNKPWLPEDVIRGIVDRGYSIKIPSDTSLTSTIEFLERDAYTINVPAPEAVSVRRFIVRESDINAPYPTHTYIKSAFGTNLDYATGGFPFGVPADQHTPDYNAVINTKQQVAISEGNKYVITFPNGFNTSRYAYTQEMDLIAYTSADVISAGSEIEITAYGETRTYVALQANGPNNTGMRILVLKEGGGIA